MKKNRLILMLSLVLFAQAIFAGTFVSEPLPVHIQDHLIKNGAWHKGCPIPLDRLDFLTISYYDFSGKEKIGHLIVLDAAAPYFLTAFKKIYQLHFPIENMGNESSNPYEETSAFNCRSVRGEPQFSVHAYGLAIDINVMRNPYIGEFVEDGTENISGNLIPPIVESYQYLNRAVVRPGMNEKIVKIMADSGFLVWGGQWQDRVDYQHFQVPDNIAINMAYLDRKSAQQFMQLIINNPKSAEKMSSDTKWKYLYKLYPDYYMQALADYFPLLKTEDEAKVYDLVYQKLSNPRKN